MLNHAENNHEVGQPADRRVWHFHQPGDASKDRWDPTPLSLACQTLTDDNRRSITRIHSVFLCPQIPGGATEVVDYAQSLADDYGLTVRCAVSRGMVTVTFERAGGQR
jgi:hypothetical protein